MIPHGLQQIYKRILLYGYKASRTEKKNEVELKLHNPRLGYHVAVILRKYAVQVISIHKERGTP